MMTSARRLLPFDQTYEAACAQRRICRECGASLPKRRRAFCSEPCRLAYLVPRVWNIAVSQVEKRDRGVCALCGFNAYAMRARFFLLKGRIQANDPDAALERRNLIAALNADGFHLHEQISVPALGKLFQVDHIIPVIEGGGGASLSNLRTLCTACHKKETAKLRARRVVSRR